MSEQTVPVEFKPITQPVYECPWCFAAVTEPQKHVDYHERTMHNIQIASLGFPPQEQFFAPAPKDDEGDST